MYAVIETGGKQYRVSPGQTVEVELLAEAPGETVMLDRVLLVSADGNTLVGQPALAGAKVIGTITNEARGKKIIVFKYKSKKRYRRTQGHRQDHSYLTITDIQSNGKSLLSEEERARYQRLAARATRRTQARMAELVETLAHGHARVAGTQQVVVREEEAIEQAGASVETETKTKSGKSGKAKK